MPDTATNISKTLCLRAKLCSVPLDYPDSRRKHNESQLGHFLQYVRQLTGQPWGEMAYRIGVDRTTLVRGLKLNGLRPISPATLMLMSTYLDQSFGLRIDATRLQALAFLPLDGTPGSDWRLLAKRLRSHLIRISKRR